MHPLKKSVKGNSDSEIYGSNAADNAPIKTWGSSQWEALIADIMLCEKFRLRQR